MIERARPGAVFRSLPRPRAYELGALEREARRSYTAMTPTKPLWKGVSPGRPPTGPASAHDARDQ